MPCSGARRHHTLTQCSVALFRVARAPCLFCISAPSAKGVFISPTFLQSTRARTHLSSYPLTYVPLTRTTIRPPRTCSLTRVGDTMPLETLEAQKSSCSEPTPVVWSATTSPLASSTVEHSSPTSPLDVAGDTRDTRKPQAAAARVSTARLCARSGTAE